MRIAHVRPDRIPTMQTTGRSQRDGGYVLVMFGLLLVPLLLMVGLAVDVGSWYNRASDIQKAADAAALAGVVYLPNVGDARDHARVAAKKNGFDWLHPDITVTVEPSLKAPRRLQVTILDERVGSFFYQSLAGGTIKISRDSFAEYVTPVPMGSPRNFFGTGQLLKNYTTSPTNFDSEELFLATNTFCADTQWGDRHQSYYKKRNKTCSNGGTKNPDYRPTGYEFYIEAKKDRGDNIEIRLWDPRLNHNNKVDGEKVIDNSRAGSDEPFTFTLFGSDPTPLYDGDNPQICQQTFDRTTPFEYSYLGSKRWNTLKKSDAPGAPDCLITEDMRDGNYILRVTNGGISRPNLVDASNQWGIVTKYENAPGDGLCDGRTDGNCPRVYGKEAISVRAAANTTAASFFLAEIPPEHTGKVLKLDLFDPGEGGKTIEIQKPTGTNSWESVPFTWKSGTSSGSGTKLDVTGSKFNDKLVEITVDLNSYSPPGDNEWWKIYYVFDGKVTDRTTWSARILGDPVHLIEEN